MIIRFVAGGSLIRISALGVDGGALALLLSLWGNIFSPSLVYKTSIIDILHRLFILTGDFLQG